MCSTVFAQGFSQNSTQNYSFCNGTIFGMHLDWNKTTNHVVPRRLFYTALQ